MSIYKSFFLLGGLEDSQIKDVLSHFPEAKKFNSGEIIYSSDNFLHCLALVVSGTVIAVTDNAQRVVMRKFSAGMCFGAAAVFGSKDSYVSNVLAESDCEIIFIDEEILKSVFHKYPQTAVNYIAFLSGRIRFLNEKLSLFSCHSTEDTLYRYLSSSLDSDGYAVLPRSMTMLSKMLGIGRASLYRNLDSLEKNGLIERKNNKIKVTENEKTN